MLVDFTGRHAFDLYLKCVQLILRHQIWFLVQEKGLPTELEMIVFDLWTVRIAQFGDKIASEESGTESQSRSRIYSTQDTTDTDTTDTERGLRKTPKERDRKLAGAPNLYDCLALCYLGILTLRLPITPGDMHAWITDGKLEYRRAIKCIPLEMRDRLPPGYHATLDPNALLDYEVFYRTMTRLQMSYEKDHGILWPPLNVPILLFRYIKDLALPIELYDTTIRLGEFLGHDFALHYDKDKRMGLRCYPEAQLIGCLIVCVKLLYPFSSKKIQPESSSEPTAIKMDWEVWCNQVHATQSKERGSKSRLTTEELMTLKEEDVFSMLPNQLDQYLDFYADTFLDQAAIQRTKDTNDFRNALYELFPIEGTEQHPAIQVSNKPPYEQKLEVIKAVQSSMKVVEAGSSKEARPKTLRPGQRYRVWKKEKDLPKHARVLYEEAAKLAGLSLDMLIMAVSTLR